MLSVTIDLRLINASGIGTYLTNLIPGVISAFPKAKFNLLGKKEELLKVKYLDAPNIHIINFNSPIYSISEQIEFLKIIPSDTNLFWSPHYNIPLFYKGKLLVTVHDVFHLVMLSFIKDIHKLLYAKIMFKCLTKKAATIICVSKFTAKELKSFFNIQDNKIKIIYNGVSQFWFNPIVTSDAPQLNFNYLLFVGNIKPHKNLNTLLDAFEIIKKSFPHHLIIVGKREGFITKDKMIQNREKELGDRVHFSGYIDNESLKHLYANADSLVFPSFYEGFGLPPIEAMACGCPVISSNSSCLPEILENNVLYFNPNNSKELAERICQLLTNDSLRNNLRREGRNHAKKFSWEQAQRLTVNSLEDLLKG
jgi:glycosyltransferase involved in cell wall biosynthesis